MHRFFFSVVFAFSFFYVHSISQYFYLFFLQPPLKLSAFFPYPSVSLFTFSTNLPSPFLSHNPQYQAITSGSTLSQNCRVRHCSPVTNTIMTPRNAAGGTATCCAIEQFNFLPFPGSDTRQTPSHVLWRWQDKLNICLGFEEFSIISRSDDKIRTL